MKGLFRKVRWGLYDCLTGGWTHVERFPFEIGSDEGSDLRLNGLGVSGRHAGLTPAEGKDICLVKREDARTVVDGIALTTERLELEREYSLRIGSHLLLLRGSKNLEEWREGLNHEAWYVYNPETDVSMGPWPLPDLCAAARHEKWDPRAVALPTGASMGFHVRDILEVCASKNLLRSAFTESSPPLETEPDALQRTSGAGQFTCPVCWLNFSLGEVMHVAVHDSLRGDPVLGQDAQLRFRAIQFNDRGQALDAFGLPCTDIACPHCRRALPPGFLELSHHIFSIVGDQSAGKSYYLSVLTKQLPVALYKNFKVGFHDGDPTGNAMLNDMKRTLFSARTPEEARLAKTQLEGAMYERLPRYGRTVALPKPFVFYLNSIEDSARRCSIIFYDNAGEHFQPGRDSADSPGAQHVASSSGILFLFDPFNKPEFRSSMKGIVDPQLERPILDQQDVILGEMKIRVKKLLNLEVTEKISQPLAVLAGKCDAWMHCLGENAFVDPVDEGRLNAEALRQNSEQVRQLMLETAPTVVSNAESISRNVMYFPVSSFGHSPIKIAAGEYVPDPRQLKPVLIEAPVLWLLSQIRPDLVPIS